jgi:hypothetical protein
MGPRASPARGGKPQGVAATNAPRRYERRRDGAACRSRGPGRPCDAATAAVEAPPPTQRADQRCPSPLARRPARPMSAPAAVPAATCADVTCARRAATIGTDRAETRYARPLTLHRRECRAVEGRAIAALRRTCRDHRATGVAAGRDDLAAVVVHGVVDDARPPFADVRCLGAETLVYRYVHRRTVEGQRARSGGSGRRSGRARPEAPWTR